MQPETKPHFDSPSGSSRSTTGARTAWRFTLLLKDAERHQVKLPLVSIVLLLFTSSSPVQADGISFLPDDALVACRAILPQCFTRADWADLCRTDASVMEAHPEACRLAMEGENL